MQTLKIIEFRASVNFTKSNFFKKFIKKNIYTKNTIIGSILSFQFQFGRSNLTHIDMEQAKYKKMFGE